MPRGTNRLDEGSRQGRLWTPAELRSVGKLSHWFDPSDFSTVTVDGSGKVSQLSDKSGNLRHATQGTSGDRPGFVVNGAYPGRRAVTYHTGGDEFLSFSSQNYNGTNGASCAVVAEHNTVSGAKTVLGHPSAGTAQLRFDGTLDEVQFIRRFQLGLAESGDGSVAENQFHVIGFDASTNNSVAWLNGVPTATTTNPGFFTGVAYIGSGGGEAMDGYIGESVISELIWTRREHDLVDGYLAWRWDLVAKLPASHPFKNRPPLIGD